MQKLLQRITIGLVLLFLLLPSLVQATDINMNLTNEVTNQTQSTNTDVPETTEDTLSPTQTNYENNSATVSTLNQLPEASLGLGNILNIILIVIGVLLILLGIAIMIRLKH